MWERLRLPEELDGRTWPYAGRDDQPLPHRHDELELNLVLRGQGGYIVGGRRIELAPRSLVWLFPGQEHVLLDEAHSLRMWIGVFKTRLVRRAAKRGEMRTLRQADPPGEQACILTRAASDRVEALCREVFECEDDPDHHNAALGYLLTTAWRSMHESDEPRVSTQLHPAVEQAARLLRQPDAPDSLDALAEEVGLSASRLSRLFSAQVGMNIPDYRNRGRIDRFLEAWGDGRSENMLHVAMACGFGSYAQFHRAFKRHMGCGPAQYQRRAKNR